jgi:DNA-binding GntR family transcriptional regulator
MKNLDTRGNLCYNGIQNVYRIGAVLEQLKIGEVPGSLVDRICLVLREDIITCRLMPGVDLAEVQVAEQFGVSRTPVREALTRLASEGLVTVTPQRGAVVAGLSFRDVLEAYYVRELIEPPACRDAANMISDDSLSKLHTLLDYQPQERPSHEEQLQYAAVDSEVHRLIIDAAGNELLQGIVRQVRSITARARSLVPYGRSVSAHYEHVRILNALRNHDAEAAEGLMREHIRNAQARLTRHCP